MSVRFCEFGELGTGKTAGCVKEAYRYHINHPNNPIYTNIELTFCKRGIERHVDSPKVLFDINEACFLLLDEMWAMADSRKSMSLLNDVMSMLLLRSRKKGWVVGYSQQWYTQTDIRLRFITEVWIAPEIKHGWMLREEIMNKHAELLRVRKYDIRKLYDLYDTYADPFTLNIDDLRDLWDNWRRKHGLVV